MSMPDFEDAIVNHIKTNFNALSPQERVSHTRHLSPQTLQTVHAILGPKVAGFLGNYHSQMTGSSSMKHRASMGALRGLMGGSR